MTRMKCVGWIGIIVLIAAFAQSAVAGEVTWLGQDTSTAGAWRSVTVPKSMLFDPNEDNIYGSDGYHFRMKNPTSPPNNIISASLPSYATVTELPGLTNYSAGSYSFIDVPNVPGTTVNVGVLFVDVVNTEKDFLKITLTENSSFVLGVIGNTMNVASSPRCFDRIRVRQTTGGDADTDLVTVSVPVKINYPPANYYFFRITGNAGDEFIISAVAPTGSTGIAMTGVTFELAGEPPAPTEIAWLGQDVSTAGAWRSGSVDKPIEFDPNDDEIYGSDGYHFRIKNPTAPPNNIISASIPTSVTVAEIGTLTAYAAGTYSFIDDPNAPGTTVNVAVRFSSTVETETDFMEVTLAEDGSFVLGVIGNTMNVASSPRYFDRIRVRQTTGGTADTGLVTVSVPAGIVNPPAHYYFFRITGYAGDAFVISAVAPAGSAGIAVTGVTLEAIPEVVTPKAATPTITPEAGVVGTDPTVTITSETAGAEIYYTIDGTVPNESSIPYTGPFTVDVDKTTVIAIAYAAEFRPSAIAAATYRIVPAANRYVAPQASLTMDGDLSDWPASATWSAPYIWWNGFELTSTTVSKVAWNDDEDVLYIAVQTNQNIGGDLELGMTKNPNVAIPMNGVESSQVLFYYTSNEANNIWIESRLAAGGVITGITGACSYDAGTGLYTYEIAHPLRSDWVSGAGDQTLSAGETIYLASILTEAEAANGMNLSYQYEPGKSAYLYLGVQGITQATCYENTWVRCASVTLEAATVANIPGDANHDGMVDVGDLGILAANYGTTSGATWEQGDFNGDGAVDVGDLGILAANYGTGIDGASDFSADYAKAFGTAADEDAIEGSSLCSGLGLPLVAGLLLMGLCLMIKMEE